MSAYNREYSKTVKPRYLSDYIKQGVYIRTLDKGIYLNHLRYIKANYKRFTVKKQGKAYIIQEVIK